MAIESWVTNSPDAVSGELGYQLALFPPGHRSSKSLIANEADEGICCGMLPATGAVRDELAAPFRPCITGTLQADWFWMGVAPAGSWGVLSGRSRRFSFIFGRARPGGVLSFQGRFGLKTGT